MFNMIEIRFVDIHGRLAAMNMPLEETALAVQDALKDPIFETGANIDGSSVEGFTPIEDSDLLLKPLKETLFELPYTDAPKLACMCEIMRDGTIYEGDTRSRLQHQIEHHLGTNKVLRVGPEPEFIIVKDDAPFDRGGYGDVYPTAAASGLIKRFSENLTLAGVSPRVHHHEVAPGQYEIELLHEDALTITDTIVNYKGLIRSLAAKNGLKATFMPKPFAGMNGNGMHMHISLWDHSDGEKINLFASGEANKLSEQGYQFIAGLLDHAMGLTALVAPTVNSYKRLVPGYEAPVYIAWAPLNRSALIRVPMFDKPEHARLEYRCPDPSCNVYMALTGIIAAGMDGIRRNLELIPPIRQNIYKMTRDERTRHAVGTLPGSLQQALECFKTDQILRDAIGPYITKRFIELKEREWLEYSTQVTNWDWSKYFNV